MAASILIDTGPILAMINRRDRWHNRCTAILPRLPLPLLTSQAVLTELLYLVRADRRAAQAVWNFVNSGAITLGAILDQDLPGLQSLMKQYADVPMDFADATLVYLAQRERLNTVFTIDSDFLVYRIGRHQRFRVLPDPALAAR
jgi:predicted nucleic acid-binding protein